MPVISQKTFDQVVLENILEFDNTLEEAISEASKEFEAQGVQLSNIVKNPKFDSNTKQLTHDIIDSLDNLKLKNSVVSNRIKNLKTIQTECEKSLAHRILANEKEAYSVILENIKISEIQNQDDVNSCNAALKAMCALTVSNSDILNEEGINIMKGHMDLASVSPNEETIQNIAKWCFECCQKHEKNRQNLVQSNVPEKLIDLLRSNSHNRNCVKYLLRSIRAFTLDDDIRAEYGKAHDHARLLVDEFKLIVLCLKFLKDFINDIDVICEVLCTLNRVLLRAEYCQYAVDNGALELIFQVINNFSEKPTLCRQSILTLNAMSGNDKVKEKVMKYGLSEVIIQALVKHQTNPGVCEACCAAISMLALRCPSHAKKLLEQGAPEAVVHTMKIHSKHLQIQKLGCMTVRNMSVRSPENQSNFIECGVESVINSSMQQFLHDTSFIDIAKAALRDLNLQVDLKEQWRGTGVELAQ